MDFTAAPVAEPSQPLLSETENPPEPSTSENTRPTISAPIQVTTTSTIPMHSGIVTEVKSTMSNRFVASSHSKSLSVRYSPVYKAPEPHIEELNFRLKTLERVYGNVTTDDSIATAAPVHADVNPSVGSDTERESDINIRQLESSVSSLSGLPSGSSTVNSPETTANSRRRHEGRNWRVERYETDF